MKDLRGYLIDGTPMKKESIFGNVNIGKVTCQQNIGKVDKNGFVKK